MRRDSLFCLGTCASLLLASWLSASATAQNPPKTGGTGQESTTPRAVDKTQEVRDLISSKRPESQKAPAQAPTYDPNEPPAIAFEPPIADMGEMIADVAKTVTVKIKNVTDQPIRITKAIPGCGCTTPVWPKEPIAPGASADCEITLRPGSKQGIKLSKNVTFQIENHAPVVLRVQGDVVAYVLMTPDIIESPTDVSAPGAKPSEVVLESTEGVAFKVTEIAPPIVKDPPMDAKTKHVLTIDWSMWEQAGRQPKVMIRTDNPKAQSMTLLVKRAIVANSPNAPTAPVNTPGPGTTDLINAVRAGDMAKVSALIASGVDVNERDRAGQRTALHWAAKSGNRPAMEVLIAAKADPNIKDRQGRTPLWGAVETELETIKFLIEKGAQVNARDQINSTPLLWAAGFGKPEMVAFLLTQKADVKATDDNGWTPLIWAAGLGQPQTVDLLVKSGADVAAADKQTGDTPLLRGARTGKAESLKILLLAGADIKATNKAGQTALHLAAASGSAEKVQMLLDAKADPAATDSKGWTALDHAMNRTTGDKAKLIEILKPVSPEPKVTGAGK
ncbi:MAG: hypothetical protein RL136_477 [Planctomycetota bacterium]